MLTAEAATLYVLSVLAPTPEGYVEVIYQDTRKLVYAECEHKAKHETEFYFYLRNLQVFVKCEKIGD